MSQVRLAYSDNGTTYTSWMNFDSVKRTLIPTVSRETGRTMRGVGYSHNSHSIDTIKFTISADELVDSTKRIFLWNFFKALAWRFTDKDTPPAVTDVILEDAGELPESWIDGNKEFPEISFIVTTKFPRTTDYIATDRI